MNAFDLLSPPVQRYIYDKGWSQLRPIQKVAIEKIMADDRNYILSSRTASGKTEAAFLPILSKIDLQRPGVRVLYISPLIALINDQFLRVEDLCRYLDIPVTKWHGEASRSQKLRLIKEPAGIVLITPESIESLFVNKPAEIKQLFGDLDYLIIDEIHSFLGAARGVHLQSLLSRLYAIQQKPFPIVALSATIGDPQEAKALTGNPGNTAVLIDSAKKTPEVRFKYFPDSGTELPTHLLEDLYTEVSDKKTLIFPNSRGRAEEIAVRLQRLAEHHGGHPYYFSHHSSVDKEVREYVEQFAKSADAAPFTISCTSTLELGIDIGSVDLVGQIDATHSIASLVQRIGRSGRREDAIPRLLFYATRPWSLLQAIACWLLYNEGFIEPVTIDRQSWDLLFHQALSLVKQHSSITRRDLIAQLTNNFAFRSMPREDIDAILDHCLATGLLEKVGNDLIIGLDGEPLVNSREFYSVFQTEEQYKVLHAGTKVGELPLSVQLLSNQNILLAARIWTIVYIDQKARRIEVKPAPAGKKPTFLGAGGTVHPRIRKKMLTLLTSTEQYPWLDESAAAILTQLRHEFSIYPLTDPAPRQTVAPIATEAETIHNPLEPATTDRTLQPQQPTDFGTTQYPIEPTASNATPPLQQPSASNAPHQTPQPSTSDATDQPLQPSASDIIHPPSPSNANAPIYRPLQPTPNGVTLYTFTGTRVLRTLSLFLKAKNLIHEMNEEEARLDIRLSPTDLQKTHKNLILSSEEIDTALHSQLTADPGLLHFSKWGPYLPIPHQVRLLKNTYYDIPAAISFLETVQWIIPQN